MIFFAYDTDLPPSCTVHIHLPHIWFYFIHLPHIWFYFLIICIIRQSHADIFFTKSCQLFFKHRKSRLHRPEPVFHTGPLKTALFHHRSAVQTASDIDQAHRLINCPAARSCDPRGAQRRVRSCRTRCAFGHLLRRLGADRTVAFQRFIRPCRIRRS